MRLHEIALALQELLLKHYQTVRVTAIQNADQFLAELSAVNPDKLPGLLIVFDNFQFVATGTIREDRISLVLIDRFRKGSDDRALRLFESSEKLFELFPPEGRKLGDVFIRPEDCLASSPKADFAAMALGLIVSQGI